MKKYFFASANSGVGFLNYLDNINQGEQSFMYIIKGGSGTGKSSMMKKIGEYFEKRGYYIEYFYCSTDVNSLDGVKLGDYNICVVDGTAPHNMDSILPGVTDKIINVGQYINNNVGQYKQEIQKIIEKKKCIYANMYLYLNSANKLMQVNKNLSKNNEKLVKIQTTNVVDRLNLAKQNIVANNRKLFLSSIQQGGLYSLLNKNKFSNVINITGSLCDCESVLQNVKNSVLNMGYNVVSLHNIIEPSMLDAIYIPQKDTILLSDTKEQNKQIEDNNKQINSLLNKAGDCLCMAREYHNKLEKYYIPEVDFCGVDKLTQQVIFEIENKINQ